MKIYVIIILFYLFIASVFMAGFSFLIFGILDKGLEMVQYAGQQHQEYLDKIEAERERQELITAFNDYLESNREAESWEWFLREQERISWLKEREQKEEDERRRREAEEEIDYNRPTYYIPPCHSGYNSFLRRWECIE